MEPRFQTAATSEGRVSANVSQRHHPDRYFVTSGGEAGVSHIHRLELRFAGSGEEVEGRVACSGRNIVDDFDAWSLQPESVSAVTEVKDVLSIFQSVA